VIGLVQKIVGGAALAILLFLIAAWKLADRRADRFEAQAIELTQLRAQDRANHEAAAREAERLNKATIARIKSDQQEISDEVTSDLNSRLERIRRELRPPSQANPGRPPEPGTGGAGSAPCRADDPAWLCVAPEERLRAAENEERHDQLINWVDRQSRVDPNAPRPSEQATGT
jgi:hypothetical protein